MRLFAWAGVFVVAVSLLGCGSGPRIIVQESVTELEAAVQADSNNPVAYYNLGVKMMSEREFAKAVPLFERAAQIDPAFNLAYFARYCAGQALLNETASADAPSPADSLQNAELQGYLNQAFGYDPFFDWRLATVLLERKQVPADPYARELYLLIDQYFVAGFREFTMGEYEAAEASLTRTLDTFPGFEQAYFVRGLARAQLKQFDEAIADFAYMVNRIDTLRQAEVLPIDVNTAQLDYLIGHAHKAKGDEAAAEAFFQKTLTQQFGFYLAHLQLANMYSGRRQYDKALREVNAALLARPDEAILHFEKGVVLSRMQRYEESAAAFAQSSALNPHYALAYLNLGLVLEQVGRQDEANDAFHRYLAAASPTRHGDLMQRVRQKLQVATSSTP